MLWFRFGLEDGYFYPSFCYLNLSFSSFRSFSGEGLGGVWVSSLGEKMIIVVVVVVMINIIIIIIIIIIICNYYYD